MKKTLMLLAVSVMCISLYARKDSIRETRIYETLKINSTSPRIDGIFDDQVWQEADWQSEFIQHMPYSGKQASFQTKFAICYDADYIYVAIEAMDPSPDSIVSRLTRRDDMDGDMVFINFDSYHDLRTCFAFDVNPAGVKSDLIFAENGTSQDETWDPVWWVKTSITNSGWNAEMKIPFSQLRFDNSGDGIWGINVGRRIYRKEEMSLWQHVPADAPGFIHLFGKLHGLKDVKPRKQAEIIPYTTAGIKSYEGDPANPFQPGLDGLYSGGVDAKIGVTNNLTLDLSVNPDFGQVEADPSEVNLTAYESFFEEKRPLFIEGKNIYNFPLMFGGGGIGAENLFYSRRIGRQPHYYPELLEGEYLKQPEQANILAAAKLSGKTRNGTSIGILESVAAEESALIDFNGEQREVIVEPLTNYFTGRVLQDINEGNTIVGGMITSTYRNITQNHLNFLPTSATTGGVDFQQYWNKRGYNIKMVNYYSRIEGSTEAISIAQQSQARLYQRPDADYVTLDTTRTSLSGYGGNFQFWKTSGRFNFLAAMVWKSPGLELNDIGFLRRSDELFQLFWMGYHFYEPFSIFRNLNLSVNQFRAWDFGGNLALGGVEGGFHATFKNFWRGRYNISLTGPKRINSFLRGGPSMLLPGDIGMGMGFSTDERKKLVIEPGFRFGKGFEDSQSSSNYSLEMVYHPINSFNISLEPELSLNSGTLQYVSYYEGVDDNRYIFSSIDQSVLSLSIRMNLTLRPDLTIQFWGQPFVATGNYFDYKYITNPNAEVYSDRYHLFSDTEINFDSDQNNFVITEENTGFEQYTFGSMDFKVKEFLSNLVIRWEYQPGSIVYLVWSQSRDHYDTYNAFQFSGDMRELWNIEPTNYFLIKLSYRIGR